jgi:hypothetical protein
MDESQEEMKIDPSRAQALVSQLNSVKERLASVANGRNVCMTLTLTTPWAKYPGLHISISGPTCCCLKAKACK